MRRDEAGRYDLDPDAIDAALAEPGLFARDPARAAVLAKGRADAVSALARVGKARQASESHGRADLPRSRGPK